MDTITDLIRDYGTVVYILLFLYCALKSGILPLFAAYAAQMELLSLPIVAIATFAGGYLGDELRFYVARKYGTDFVENKPFLKHAMDKARLILARYGTTYIFLYRYPKGLRTIGALPMGMTDISWLRFSALNAASAVLWTIILLGLGYLFGQGIEQAIGSNWGLISIGLLVSFIAVSAFAYYHINRVGLSPNTKV